MKTRRCIIIALIVVAIALIISIAKAEALTPLQKIQIVQQARLDQNQQSVSNAQILPSQYIFIRKFTQPEIRKTPELKKGRVMTPNNADNCTNYNDMESKDLFSIVSRILNIIKLRL